MSVSLSRVDGPGDAELIAAVRGGDVDAYGELFARHVDAARRLARQLAGPGDADDLVSDAFTKVLTVLQRGGGPDLAFRAYLLTAVRRLHVDRIRSGSRLRPVDDLTPFDPGVPFHDTAVEGFDNATAAKAFASLPERWQMVLWHTEVEQQKPADIAVLLGMSANSVSALAYRAREGLRQAFLSMHAADPDDIDCGWTRDHLGAYVRGGLSRRDVARVDDHLEDCRTCAAVYLELTEVNSGLAALLAPLLLGTAGAAYLSSGGAAGGVSGLTTAWAATRSWLGSHTVVTAVGGVMAASVASVAIYVGAQTILANPAADTSGVADHPLQSISQSGQPGTSGPGQGRSNRQQGRAGDQTRGTGPSASGSASLAPTTALPTASDSATDPLSSATTDPASNPATDPGTAPGTGPGTGGGPTNPTTGPTGPTAPGADPVTFTSTPPPDPAFGTKYRLQASGGAGKGIVFSIAPATTHRACSLDDAGTTVTFDHAGTCVIAAHATTRSAARIVAARGAADDVTQTVQVPKGRQQVDFQLSGTVRVGATLPLSATRGASGRPVTFTVETPGVCSIVGAGSGVTFRHAKPCTVTAHENGDDDYHAAPDRTRTVDVAKGDQHVAFTLTSDRAVVRGTGTLAVTAQGDSGNPVAFSSTTPGACTVSGSTVTFDHAQACSVEATQPGSDDYNAADAVSHTLQVGKADQHIAFTSVPPADPTLHGQFTVSATGGDSGNPVTFTSTTPAVCTVTGTTVTLDHAGTCTVAADQVGDDDYLAAPTLTRDVTIHKAPQAISFTLPTAPALGSSHDLVATGGGSGNAVTFASTTPEQCSATGSTVTFDHAGICVIAADQAGNDDYEAAPTVTQAVGVAKAAQSITFTSRAPADPALGGTYVVSATGGDSGNPVTFSVAPATTNNACTVAGSTVTFRHAGICVIAADQAGNDDYEPATTARQSVAVPKVAQSITFTSTPPAQPTLHGSYTVTATGGDSGKPVTFGSATPAVCSVTGSTVTFDHAGTCIIAADQAGNDDYEPATTARQSVAVPRATQTITFTTKAPTPGYVGTTYAVSATGGDSGNPVVFRSATPKVCTVSGSTVTFGGTGTCSISADQAGTPDYDAAPTVTQNVNVVVRDADLAVTATKGADIGGLSGVTASVTGLPADATATLTASASGSAAFRPEGVAADACTRQTATRYTCQVKAGQTGFTFAVNTENSRDVTFAVEPDPPLTDSHRGNNTFVVHWHA